MRDDLFPEGTKVTYITPDTPYARSEEVPAVYLWASQGKQNRHAIEITKDGKTVRRFVSSSALRRGV